MINISSDLWYLLDVFIACVLTGAVGYERAVHHKPAGFRTQMIVGGASALLVKLAHVAVANFAAAHKDVLEIMAPNDRVKISHLPLPQMSAYFLKGNRRPPS